MEELAQTKEELKKKVEYHRKPIEKPTTTCGLCAYYKTPKCTFENMSGYIMKQDGCCSDFFPDRHIPRNRLKKLKLIQRRIE